jgi:hypothetical protein
MGVARGPKIVTDGLVYLSDAGNHKSYPGIGTAWTDIVGRKAGTLSNVTFTEGSHLTYAATNSYTDLGLTDGTVLENPFAGGGTVSVWVKPLSEGNPNNGGRIIQVSSLAAAQSWLFLVADQNEIIIIIRFSTTDADYRVDNVVPFGEWINITITYNESTPTTPASIYKNGVLQVLTTSINGVDTPVSDVGKNMWIGNNRSTVLDRAFDGDIDIISFYDRELTAAEVQQNFNAHRGRFEL